MKDSLVHRGITRRGFTLGSVLTAAVASASAVLTGCGSSSSGSSETGEPQVVNDSSKITSVTEDYQAVNSSLEATSTWTIDIGTVLHHSEGTWTAAMLTPESASQINTVGALGLKEGNLVTLVDSPVSGESYSFFDTRIGTGALAWLEIDYATCKWRLYAQACSGGALSGDPVKIDAGTRDYEPPLFDVTGTSVIWYKMPSSSGSHASEESVCYRRFLNDSSASELWKSSGQFACQPNVSDGILTITPRVRANEGVYYGMTAIDLSSNNKKVAQLVLPSTVKPFAATYIGGKFAFSVEATYDGKGSLGKIGSYIGAEGGPYIYFAREPFAGICGKNGRYIVKTKSSNILINTKKKTYEAVLSPDRATGYGDFTATEGESKTFLTYSTVRDSKGIPESVTARLFSL